VAKKPSTVKESEIERELVAVVHGRGGVCEKIMCVGKRGFFDRLIILPGGRIIFAEIKRPRGGRISPHQRQYYDTLRTLGVEACFVRNSEDIVALLSQKEGPERVTARGPI
jgi:hypothetical protein